MIVQTWSMALQQSFQNVLWGVVSFIPSLILAIIIFLIGWFLGVLLGRVVAEAVRALKVDHALRAAGVEEVVSHAGYRMDSGVFLGALVKWFVIIVFLLAALQVLGLLAVTYFLETQLLPYLSNVIIAVLIVLVAAVVAEVVQGVVAGSARAAGLRAAGFAGAVARWAIWIFGILAALSQLGVGPFAQMLFQGVVIAVALAIGLAFGLGGQEAAARAIEKAREQMTHRH